MGYRYTANIYSGRTYCGNGYFETLEECKQFFENDYFADKMVVMDSETGKKQTIKKEEQK